MGIEKEGRRMAKEEDNKATTEREEGQESRRVKGDRETENDKGTYKGDTDRRRDNQCNGCFKDTERNIKFESEYSSLSSISSLIICL